MANLLGQKFGTLTVVSKAVGYEIDNCVPCCRFCNKIKDRTTPEEFVNWAKQIYKRGVKNGFCSI